MASAKENDSQLTLLEIHDHPCSIYETAEELKRQFVPYLQAGLVLGERCVYFIDESDENFVIDAMRVNKFDIERHLKSGAFAIIHTKDAHTKDDHFAEAKMMSYWSEALAQSQRAGFPSMRAAVEMTWALAGVPGSEMLTAYEARLNDFVDKNKVSVLCQYNRKRFPPSKLKAVIHAHPILVAEDHVMRNNAVVHHERFVEDSAELDLQVLMDNMFLIKKLQTAQDSLEEAFDELNEVSYMISHELQEPLTVIRSYQKLLAVRYKGRLGSDADDFIQRCSEATAIIERMIDDLWTYARITRSGQPFVRINSEQVIIAALKKIEPQLGAPLPAITYYNLPMVIGVEEQLIELFRKLLENAIVHSGSKSASINIVATEASDGFWQFALADDGAGIDSVRVMEAFRMFNRLDKRPGADGSGMGLPVARKIVEFHQGQLRISSQLGKGVTVLFTLPGATAQFESKSSNFGGELNGRRRRRLLEKHSRDY